MPPNVHVPKLLPFRRTAFHLRSSICTHAPLAMPPSPLSRIFANTDKEDRLSPARRAASQWSTHSNSDPHCRFRKMMREMTASVVSFYCFVPSLDDPRQFSLPTRPSLCPILCGFTRKLCPSSTVGSIVLAIVARHSSIRASVEKDSWAALLGSPPPFLSVLWSRPPPYHSHAARYPPDQLRSL
jgi:hypothetical protein